MEKNAISYYHEGFQFVKIVSIDKSDTYCQINFIF